ncbi:hypothetical protein CBR_g84604, partial [Chara braunii]
QEDPLGDKVDEVATGEEGGGGMGDDVAGEEGRGEAFDPRRFPRDFVIYYGDNQGLRVHVDMGPMQEAIGREEGGGGEGEGPVAAAAEAAAGGGGEGLVTGGAFWNMLRHPDFPRFLRRAAARQMEGEGEGAGEEVGMSEEEGEEEEGEGEEEEDEEILMDELHRLDRT